MSARALLAAFPRRQAAGEIERVDRRRRRHRQHVAVAHVHHHHRRARIRAVMGGDGFLGGALQIQVNRQHHVLARLRLAPDVFRLAVALAVDQHDSAPARPRSSSSKPHSTPTTPRKSGRR
jgi:hypothetical protein